MKWTAVAKCLGKCWLLLSSQPFILDSVLPGLVSRVAFAPWVLDMQNWPKKRVQAGEIIDNITKDFPKAIISKEKRHLKGSLPTEKPEVSKRPSIIYYTHIPRGMVLGRDGGGGNGTDECTEACKNIQPDQSTENRRTALLDQIKAHVPQQQLP